MVGVPSCSSMATTSADDDHAQTEICSDTDAQSIESIGHMLRDDNDADVAKDAEMSTMELLGLSLPQEAVSDMPSYAESVYEELKANPAYVCPHQQWRMAEKKAKAKGKAKAKASFKRGKSIKAASKGIMKGKEPGSMKRKKPEAIPAVIPASEVEAVASPGVVELKSLNLEQLLDYLRRVGVPEQAMPDAICKGKWSYTKKCSTNAARIEVNIKLRHFRVLSCSDGKKSDDSGATPNKPWSRHGGIQASWDHTTEIAGWIL